MSEPVVRIKKRTNPLAVVMCVVFELVALGMLGDGGVSFTAVFVAVAGLCFLGVKEDAQ